MSTEPAAPQGAPIELEVGSTDPDFNANMDAFLNHNFDEPDPFALDSALGVAEPSVAVSAAEPSVALQSAVVSIASSVSSPAAISSQVSAAPAATSVGTSVAASAASAVDPNLLAQMLGAAPIAASIASVAAPAAAVSAPAAEAPYAPIPANFALPPELTSAIFESDDPRTREKALSALMASYGNAILQIADQRMAAHHAPRFLAQAQEAHTVQTQAAAIHTDFYSTFPELAPYKAVVAKAMEVVRGASPANATYSPEMRNQIGNLARQAVTQMGLQMPASGAPATSAAAPVVERPAAPGQIFEAGGARPGYANGQDNSPAAIYNEMNF